MPAIISHYLFGEQMLAAYDYERFPSFDEHNAFMLGNQGPDPLYYLFTTRSMSSVHLLGTRMHRENIDHEFDVMRSYANSMGPRNKAIARAFLDGFICHFMLDSTTHPLIYAQVRELTSAGVPGLDGSASSEVHGLIEADLDCMMLWRMKGVDITRFRPYQKILWGNAEVLELIDKICRYVAASVYHVTLRPGTYQMAIRNMRLVRRAFWSPLGIKSSLLGAAERLFREHSLIQAMSNRADIHETCDFANDEHRTWKRPSTHKTSTASFEDLFNQALDGAVPAIASSDEGKPASTFTHGLNFIGVPSVVY
jgi:hypothetical protein